MVSTCWYTVKPSVMTWSNTLANTRTASSLPERLGAELRLSLREAAGGDWRRQPPGSDHRGVGEICPVADRQTGKGMLTGPVTILCWSFPREDVTRETIAKQIALALRDEVADLEAAGIGIIQIDEPALREGLPLRRSDWAAYLEWEWRPSALTRR